MVQYSAQLLGHFWMEFNKIGRLSVLYSVFWPFHVFYFVLAGRMLLAAYGAHTLPKRL
jgi:hypothetical protein